MPVHKVKEPPVIPGGIIYSLRVMLLGKKLNILLVFIPLAVIGDRSGWSPGITFALALAALCPLAERINFLTEQCSGWSSEVIAAILNVSFGNATELIVSVFALKAGLLRVLQLSLLGAWPTQRRTCLFNLRCRKRHVFSEISI